MQLISEHRVLTPDCHAINPTSVHHGFQNLPLFTFISLYVGIKSLSLSDEVLMSHCVIRFTSAMLSCTCTLLSPHVGSNHSWIHGHSHIYRLEFVHRTSKY